MSGVQAGVELSISLCHLNVDQNEVGGKYWSRKQLNPEEIQQPYSSLLPALKKKIVTKYFESMTRSACKVLVGS